MFVRISFNVYSVGCAVLDKLQFYKNTYLQKGYNNLQNLLSCVFFFFFHATDFVRSKVRRNYYDCKNKLKSLLKRKKKLLHKNK